MKGSPDLLDSNQASLLIKHTHNIKHRACLLLMLDTGLRVTEAVSLRYQDFDFKEKIIHVKPTYKKGSSQQRAIPISDRLYRTLAQYIQTQKPASNRSYLFPGKNGHHLTRKAINRLCDRIKAKYPEEFRKLHPYTLRHTFAMQHLAHGAQIADLKNILGHESLATTTHMYSHTPLDTFKKSIAQVTNPPQTTISSIKNWLFPTKKTLININTQSFDFTIGRQTKISHIYDLIHKNQNTILLGPIGVGKSHLIKQIKPQEKKILYIDDCSDIKRTLIQCLLYLYKNDKEAIFKLIYGDYDLNKLQQHLQRDSIPNLTREITKVTSPKEYVLIIDTIDNITTRGVKALEALKDHFTILTSAREIPLNKSSLLWNFEIIHVKELNRHHSIALIQQLSNGLEIEDFELYKNHVYEQTNGNPRAIIELIDRYRKEPYVTADIIRKIKHTGNRKEYDMSILVLTLLGGLTTLRYFAHEAGNDRLRLIGGIALLLLITARYFFRISSKKRTIN
jgi:integrase/recombinase XerD